MPDRIPRAPRLPVWVAAPDRAARTTADSCRGRGVVRRGRSSRPASRRTPRRGPRQGCTHSRAARLAPCAALGRLPARDRETSNSSGSAPRKWREAAGVPLRRAAPPLVRGNEDPNAILVQNQMAQRLAEPIAKHSLWQPRWRGLRAASWHTPLPVKTRQPPPTERALASMSSLAASLASIGRSAFDAISRYRSRRREDDVVDVVRQSRAG